LFGPPCRVSPILSRRYRAAGGAYVRLPAWVGLHCTRLRVARIRRGRRIAHRARFGAMGTI